MSSMFFPSTFVPAGKHQHIEMFSMDFKLSAVPVISLKPAKINSVPVKLFTMLVFVMV